MTAPRWLLCRERRAAARLRMYCFPHSGGSPGEYLRWSDALPGVEVWGVQFPGRGSRLDEPPVPDMERLVTELVSEAGFEGPCVFFGHSLGALVAYETALALRERGLPGPVRLYLSAYRAPHLHEPGPDLSRLHGPGLIAAIESRHGPLPDEVKSDPDLRELLLPALKADLTVVATYRPAPYMRPLDCPLTVLGGHDDEESGERLTAWRRYTTGHCDVRSFPGDHFYFRENTDDFLRFLGADLDECAARAVPGPGPLGSAPPVS
ncbi:thioesterase II family protein [Streptomyces sp. NPDC091292]|uniref:thioesterase II family protein n=1 Tax=Streptomyces sp. NPDC091292 TaxID=3365991 RepID=UPI0037F8D49F